MSEEFKATAVVLLNNGHTAAVKITESQAISGNGLTLTNENAPENNLESLAQKFGIDPSLLDSASANLGTLAIPAGSIAAIFHRHV